MTIKNNKDDDNKPRDNIFEIMDGIIVQLNRTKKMFIIMILTLMIIPPVAFAVTFALLGPPLYFDTGSRGGDTADSFGPPPQIAVARTIPILISLIWLGIGIRQWFVLSKWSKKYERYKELQKRVDQKLDYDNDDDEGKKEKQ
jgi:hypothetical protein